jgi:hypothetical protein
MTNRLLSLCFSVLLLLVAIPAGMLLGEELVVYQQGLACVQETREVQLTAGMNEIELTGVPTELIPASLSIGVDGEILSQSFHYTPAAGILNEYIGKEIEVVSQEEGKLYRGILISADSAITIQASTGEHHVIKNPVRITLPPLKGFTTAPYVDLAVRRTEGGDAQLSLLYLTRGVDWQANYIGFLNPAQSAISLEGWISIANSCGRDFKHAAVSLIAGELNQQFDVPMAPRGEMAPLAFQPKVSESTAFEYHLYQLPGTLTLPHGETILVPYTVTPSVDVEKKYTYDGARQEGVQVEFIWGHDTGMALPAGTVRLFHRRDAGTIFIGQSTIPHTPLGEDIELKVGSSFDLVGERTQVSREKIAPSTYRETYRITLRNHKAEKITVDILEHPAGDTWKIINAWLKYKEKREGAVEFVDKEQPFEKVDSSTVKFVVHVPAHGESEVTYTVEYSY